MSNTGELQNVSIDSLWVSNGAVRKNSAQQIAKAAKFLSAAGSIPLVLAAPSGKIIHGAEFWHGQKAIGATTIDVVFLHGKTEAELRLIEIAVPRIAQHSLWNKETLGLAI